MLRLVGAVGLLDNATLVLRQKERVADGSMHLNLTTQFTENSKFTDI